MKSIQVILAVLLFATLATPAVAQKMKIGDPTKNNGKVEFEPMQIETGEIPFGVPIERAYSVKNVSDEDLIILDVKSGCHCTVVDWPKEPLKPGQSASIKITYDALKEGQFYKIVSVNTNFDPEVGVGLSMVGTVLPK